MKFFCYLRLGREMVLGHKISGSGIRYFGKSGKTRILGYYLTNLAEIFLLAPSGSRDGFRSQNFRIRDPVFPKIWKNPDFRVLFDQFSGNTHLKHWFVDIFGLCIKGQSPETKIAAKPLDASGEAAGLNW